MVWDGPNSLLEDLHTPIARGPRQLSAVIDSSFRAVMLDTTMSSMTAKMCQTKTRQSAVQVAAGPVQRLLSDTKMAIY